MKTKHILFAIMALLFVTFTGCKKYEDGPTLSLELKSWRVENTWKIDEYINIASGITTQANSDITYQFKSGDEYIITSGSFSWTGTWEFGSDKETIKTDVDGVTDEMKILRLKSDELWVEDMDGITETHYIPAD